MVSPACSKTSIDNLGCKSFASTVKLLNRWIIKFLVVSGKVWSKMASFVKRNGCLWLITAIFNATGLLLLCIADHTTPNQRIK